MFMRLRDKRAFTLIEIMIVVAIIGLLVAIAVPNYLSSRKAAKDNAEAANVRIIKDALFAYVAETPTVDPSEGISGVAWEAYLRDGMPNHPGTTTPYVVSGNYDDATVL